MDAEGCHLCQEKGYLCISVMREDRYYNITPCKCDGSKYIKWFLKLNQDKVKEPRDRSLRRAGYAQLDRETYTKMKEMVVKRLVNEYNI